MKRFTSFLLAVGAATAFTGSAWAATTTIQTNGEIGGGPGVSQDGPTNELPDVLARAYGGAGATYSGNINTSWSITGGTLGSNVLTLTRVQDSGGVSPVYLDGSNSGTANDSLWNSGTSTGENLALKAIVAGDNQTFGYQYVNGSNALIGSASNEFTNAVSGSTATTSITLSNANNFVWYDHPSNGDTFYSDQALNTNSSSASAYTTEDHQVTFLITENGHALNGATASWLLCFEDTPGAGSDFDYNDLVVEVDATAATVPLPASAWMGLVTMAGLGAVVALRRRSQMA